jgi:hypothetical protein
MSGPVRFMQGNGLTIAIVPQWVMAVQDGYFSPGMSYKPYCTVSLSTGEKITLPMSAAEVVRKLWPDPTP